MKWTEEELKPQFDKVISRKWLDLFKASANKYNFKTEEILAIASRETNIENIRGDFHHGIYHGYGVMQIDINSYSEWCHSWNANKVSDSILMGAFVLNDKRIYLNNRGIFKPEYIYASYNCDQGNVFNCVNHNINPDTHTTGGDYGIDVLNRVQIFAKFLLQLPAQITS